MSDLRERLRAAVWRASAKPTVEEQTDAILAADPALARRYELGWAWEEAEAALPEGWSFYTLEHHEAEGRWQASASHRLEPDRRPHTRGKWKPTWEFREGTGPTPTAALLALAARLREGA